MTSVAIKTRSDEGTVPIGAEIHPESICYMVGGPLEYQVLSVTRLRKEVPRPCLEPALFLHLARFRPFPKFTIDFEGKPTKNADVVCQINSFWHVFFGQPFRGTSSFEARRAFCFAMIPMGNTVENG